MNTATENGMNKTFEQLELPICQLQTVGLSEHLVKISASPEEGRGLTESEVALCEKFLESWKKQKRKISPHGLFMKTLKECCLATEGSTSCQSSLKWTDLGTMQNGKLSTQNGMFHKIGSDVWIDTFDEDINGEIYLSTTCCTVDEVTAWMPLPNPYKGE